MEMQLGDLTYRVCWLKRCIELKGMVGLGLGQGWETIAQLRETIEIVSKGKTKAMGRDGL